VTIFAYGTTSCRLDDYDFLKKLLESIQRRLKEAIEKQNAFNTF
jgi:hypothetical protein